ncbi:hypothetical protein [Nostoc sp. 'Peltigera membranacea cyanobiont' 210A]|uniref:hypothetical protein n=1 Tax=Nostoc sp. 'Peltigera membranacea cyanobiont' 210A TaxID=2014529 RepID=UPI00167EAD26|nr:hypothetical protein [Nostoc sp. 'Peltigera membranacea cyanobiont' 210A]
MNKTQYTFIPSSQSPVPSPQSLTSTSDSEIKSDCYIRVDSTSTKLDGSEKFHIQYLQAEVHHKLWNERLLVAIAPPQSLLWFLESKNLKFYYYI